MALDLNWLEHSVKEDITYKRGKPETVAGSQGEFGERIRVYCGDICPGSKPAGGSKSLV